MVKTRKDARDFLVANWPDAKPSRELEDLLTDRMLDAARKAESSFEKRLHDLFYAVPDEAGGLGELVNELDVTPLVDKKEGLA